MEKRIKDKIKTMLYPLRNAVFMPRDPGLIYRCLEVTRS